MTTMGKVDEMLARFDRKSPRDAYKQLCVESKLHCQHRIYNLLPSVPSAWHRIRTLELDDCILGPKGCMMLLPVVLCSNTLRKISVRTCGVTDEFVKELCDILQGHPSVRSVDVSENELVSVYSASPIINLMRNNSNMIAFHVDKTHVGDNVGKIIQQLGVKNTIAVATYYQDNYFKLKDLFNYLDENGYGWVLLKSIVLNCPYPILQEQFTERISLKKPKKRSDNSVSINTFLQLVYMNYKTEKEIAQFAEGSIDEPYVFTIANWKQLISATERYNAQEGVRPIVLPEDFHRVRIREYLLVDDDADSVIRAAADYQHQDNQAALALLERPDEPVVHQTTIYTQTNLDQARTESDPLQIYIYTLLKAVKTAFIPPPSMKPEYQFYKDRDAAYIPDCMRNGSRLMSFGGMAMLNSTSRAASVVTLTETATDPNDPLHTFSLPASVVKLLLDFFNLQVSKLPKKKESVIPDSPRTQKDKAMEKSAIPIETFLSAEFVTDLEKIQPRFLSDYYARFALPIEDCTITLQEMINVLDEYYVHCRLDIAVSLEQIKGMLSPLKDTRFAEFLSKHLVERDEDVYIIEPLRESVSY